jgi:hypothetical protein
MDVKNTTSQDSFGRQNERPRHPEMDYTQICEGVAQDHLKSRPFKESVLDDRLDVLL